MCLLFLSKSWSENTKNLNSWITLHALSLELIKNGLVELRQQEFGHRNFDHFSDFETLLGLTQSTTIGNVMQYIVVHLTLTLHCENTRFNHRLSLQCRERLDERIYLILF